MKSTCTIIFVMVAIATFAQTRIDRTVPVAQGQTIRMRFDYPKLVHVSTWDGKDISITGTVSINGGESDDAFKLEIDNQGNSVYIRNEIRNMKDLPQRITVDDGGQKIVFRNKAEFRKYQDEHGTKHRSVNFGVDLEIELEIKVPRNFDTRVEAIYGMVEIRDFDGPISVQATYGGVDASLSEKKVGELIAETNYGNIYTNLDFKPDRDNMRDEDFHMYVSATLGTGPKCRFESQYGNVYLRKSTSQTK